MQQTMKETNPERMMTVQQVADLLQVSICSIRRWSDKGILKFYRVGNRGDRRFWREDVFHFLVDSSPHLRAGTTN